MKRYTTARIQAPLVGIRSGVDLTRSVPPETSDVTSAVPEIDAFPTPTRDCATRLRARRQAVRD
jgi:hypothetical protein